MSYRILLVDDDKGNIESTKVYLESSGYKIDGVNSGEKAIDLLKDPDVEYAFVLMDYFMPDLNGVQTAEKILSFRPSQLIAMYSCDDSKELVKEAIRVGVVDYIEKSMNPQDFLIRVQKLCAKYEHTAKPITRLSVKTEPSETIVRVGLTGASKAMAEVSQQIEKFAAADRTVMITGETGTGKEEVARALHRLSARSSRAFVAVNCAAIPESLIESTLFGHVKGAFTGAVKDQLGKFAIANHGTLFLDEIGDLPLTLQAKLLRVLQERVFEPVGSNRSEKVDVRIIAATHKNLEQLVSDGKFREDLFYRLNILPIHIPPLRDRLEDIEPLVGLFCSEFARSSGIQKKFERRTLQILCAYHWPGNVRELKHVVEKHMILCPGNLVKVEHLESKLFEKPVSDGDPVHLQILQKRQWAEIKVFIEKRLRASRSKAEAARKMGISPSKLHYYLETYGISA